MQFRSLVTPIALTISLAASHPVLDPRTSPATVHDTTDSNRRQLFERLVDDGIKSFQPTHHKLQIYSISAIPPGGPSKDAEAFSQMTLQLLDSSTSTIWQIHNRATALFDWSVPVRVQPQFGVLSWPWGVQAPDVCSLMAALQRLDLHGFAAEWDEVRLVKESSNPFSGSLEPEVCYCFERSRGTGRLKEKVVYGVDSGRFRREVGPSGGLGGETNGTSITA